MVGRQNADSSTPLAEQPVPTVRRQAVEPLPLHREAAQLQVLERVVVVTSAVAALVHADAVARTL